MTVSVGNSGPDRVIRAAGRYKAVWPKRLLAKPPAPRAALTPSLQWRHRGKFLRARMGHGLLGGGWWRWSGWRRIQSPIWRMMQDGGAACAGIARSRRHCARRPRRRVIKNLADPSLRLACACRMRSRGYDKHAPEQDTGSRGDEHPNAKHFAQNNMNECRRTTHDDSGADGAI